jgi:hypothetical protein
MRIKDRKILKRFISKKKDRRARLNFNVKLSLKSRKTTNLSMLSETQL